MSELIALAGDREIGRVRMERGQLSFRYADDWLAGSSWHFPLSLALASQEHGNRIVSPYLSNLLPDNTDILRRWRQRYGVRSNSLFALLEHVGEGCAGAVSTCVPTVLKRCSRTGPSRSVVE